MGLSTWQGATALPPLNWGELGCQWSLPLPKTSGNKVVILEIGLKSQKEGRGGLHGPVNGHKARPFVSWLAGSRVTFNHKEKSEPGQILASDSCKGAQKVQWSRRGSEPWIAPRGEAGLSGTLVV